MTKWNLLQTTFKTTEHRSILLQSQNQILRTSTPSLPQENETKTSKQRPVCVITQWPWWGCYLYHLVALSLSWRLQHGEDHPSENPFSPERAWVCSPRRGGWSQEILVMSWESIQAWGHLLIPGTVSSSVRRHTPQDAANHTCRWHLLLKHIYIVSYSRGGPARKWGSFEGGWGQQDPTSPSCWGWQVLLEAGSTHLSLFSFHHLAAACPLTSPDPPLPTS